MSRNAEQKVLHIPLPVFESAETKEELEEWLLVNDPVFIREMRQLKEKADQGAGRPLADVVKKWDIKL